ncbi:MAG: hypothetical protein FWD82_06860 [Defluviitaleaceae bacterium]|nr:hypothetical protein [Defluviitaleaceae bacterium]
MKKHIKPWTFEPSILIDTSKETEVEMQGLTNEEKAAILNKFKQNSLTNLGYEIIEQKAV